MTDCNHPIPDFEEITRIWLDSGNLYQFLEKLYPCMGTHMGILLPDMTDPSETDPVEDLRYSGPMKPVRPLMVENVQIGFLSVEQAYAVSPEAGRALDIIARFVSRMPEVSVKIHIGSNAYQVGIYELLSSSDIDRMASLRAQIGISRFEEKGRSYNCFLIYMLAKQKDGLLSGLETRLREGFLGISDVLLHYGEGLVLFRVQEGDTLDPEYAGELEALLDAHHAIGCVSDPIRDPTHDFRLRQYYNTNAQVLSYLIKSGHTEKSLVLFDDYRLVSMVYFAQIQTNHGIFGPYRFVCSTVKRICEYDAEKGTDYFRTLSAYLSSRASLNAAAKKLNVHRNTVVYRIAQLRDRFGIDFDDSECCFRMELACRVYDIATNIDRLE